MQELFFTSDTHFNHDREFIFRPRGFETIQEHDEAIITNWNHIVGPHDIVYHLGDFMMGQDIDYGIECMRRLNGEIYFIIGNHDTTHRLEALAELPNVTIEGHAVVIGAGGYRFFACHYPVISTPLGEGSNLKHTLLNCHGHTHNKSQFYNENPTMINVGLDAWRNYPVHWETMIAEANKQLEECYNFC